MLTYTDAVLRILLTRLEVDPGPLSRLIEVTAALFRRTQSNDGSSPTNTILAVIFELLGDGLQQACCVLSRMLPKRGRSLAAHAQATGHDPKRRRTTQWTSANRTEPYLLNGREALAETQGTHV